MYFHFSNLLDVFWQLAPLRCHRLFVLLFATAVGSILSLSMSSFCLRFSQTLTTSSTHNYQDIAELVETRVRRRDRIVRSLTDNRSDGAPLDKLMMNCYSLSAIQMEFSQHLRRTGVGPSAPQGPSSPSPKGQHGGGSSCQWTLRWFQPSSARESTSSAATLVYF